MSQPIKVSAGTPSGEFSVIDNSAAPAITVLNAGAPIGYDTTAPGAIAQGSNTFSNGSVLLDSVNDTVPQTYDMATVVGNPVSNIAPTGKVLTTVINNATTGIRILLKNPA
jgi:hypothetical protein